MQPGSKPSPSGAQDARGRAVRRVAWAMGLGCPVQLVSLIALTYGLWRLAGLSPEAVKAAIQRRWGAGLQVSASLSRGGPASLEPADPEVPFTSADRELYVRCRFTGAPRGARLDFRTLINGVEAPEFSGSLDLPDRAFGTAVWRIAQAEGLPAGFWEVEVSSGGHLLAWAQTSVLPADGSPQARLVRVSVSSAYDEAARRPFEVSHVFPRTITEVFVHFEWTDAPRKGILKMKVRRDGRELEGLAGEVKLGENRRGAGRSRLHMADGFPPGDYEVSLLLEGRPIGKARFRVK